MITDLIIIFVLHYIGDFLLQPREIATKKSKSIIVLLEHGLYYGMFMLFVGIFFFRCNGVGFLQFVGVNTLLHVVTDFFTSKLTTHFYLKDKHKAFFDTIGVDQLIHIITILLTYKYFLI